MIEQDIYDALRNYAGLSSLVSTRVYPVTLPQEVMLPSISFFRVSTVSVSSASGHSGMDNLRVQVDCWGETYLSVRNIAAQVKLAMESSAKFKTVRDSDRDMYESGLHVHRAMLDFSVWAAT